MWLTPWRLAVYPRALALAIFVAFGALVTMSSRTLFAPTGLPLGGDFVVFRAVGELVDAGQIDALFDPAAIQRAQAHAVGREVLPGYHAWVYPTYSAILFAPLARLPYVASFVVYSLLMVGALYAASRFVASSLPRLAGHHHTLFFVACTFYPAFRAMLGGQNVTLSLGLVGGAIALVMRGRELAAGLLLGALFYKPHFGLLFAVLFAVAGYLRALAVAAGVGLAWGGVGVALAGWDWPVRWLHTVAAYRDLEANVNGPRLVSFLGVCEQIFGTGHPLAWALGGLLSLALFGVLVAVLWKSRTRPELRWPAWALAAVGVLLLSPHTQFYEVGLLVLPLAVVADVSGMRAAPHLFAIWLLGATHALGTPPIQPLFFVTLYAGYVVLTLAIRPVLAGPSVAIEGAPA